MDNSDGKITRISGPIVHADGLGGAGLFDLVEVGEKRIAGEIIRIVGSEVIIQVYEDETGLKPGLPVRTTGRPLSALLGPGLIGQIFDGIQRPLFELYKKDGPFMQVGSRSESLDRGKKWHFVPQAELAEQLSKGEAVEVLPGATLGTVKETESINCKIMVPPNTPPSALVELLPEGDYDLECCVAKLTGLSGAGRNLRSEIPHGASREISLCHWWPVRTSRPNKKRLAADRPLITGQRVIDIFFPLAKGGTAAIPGGFGTGKTMTQHAVAKWCDADIIVYIGCGERGNEMTDVLTEFPSLIDPRTGRSLMERTILIANTSNMPVAAREVSIYTGVTLAEFYRDMGYDVAIMADSTSRWAEALRELSGRMEEMPAEEGFPAYLPSRLAEFYERAGRVETLGGGEGSVSIIGAVSPPGGDFSEPVTQHTKRFIRCFWALDRELANARHYPAISWLDSYSEYAPDLGQWWEKVNAFWSPLRIKALELLKREQRLEEIVRLIGAESLPDDQKLILITADILKNGFLQQNSFDERDMFCSPEKQAAILSLIMDFYDRSLELVKSGVALVRVTALPIREELSRLKSEVANDNPQALAAVQDSIRSSLDALKRK